MVSSDGRQHVVVALLAEHLPFIREVGVTRMVSQPASEFRQPSKVYPTGINFLVTCTPSLCWTQFLRFFLPAMRGFLF